MTVITMSHNELTRLRVLIYCPSRWCSTGGDRPFAIAHKPLCYRQEDL